VLHRKIGELEETCSIADVAARQDGKFIGRSNAS
jgi:hypothetical protein